jgi:hypothetical protein
LDLKCDFEPHPNLSYAITIEMRGPGPALAQNCFAAFDPWLADKPDLMANLLTPAKFKGLAQLIAASHPACVWIKLGDPKAIAGPVTNLVSGIAGSFNPMPPIGLLPPIEGGRRRTACRRSPAAAARVRSARRGIPSPARAAGGRCAGMALGSRPTVAAVREGRSGGPRPARAVSRQSPGAPTRGGADPTAAAVRPAFAGATAPAGHPSLPSRAARASGGFPRAPALPCR